MKILSFILAFFLPIAAGAVDLCPTITKDGTTEKNCDLKFTGDVEFTGTVTGAAPEGALTKDDAVGYNVQLYVDPLGSDDNECTSGGSAACLTIQAAIDKVPHVVTKAYNISVKTGTYKGFKITNRHFSDAGPSFSYGRINLFCGNSVTTGSQATGTITGGTDYSFTDNTKNWPVNQFRGSKVGSGGAYFVVASNTSDTVYFAQKNVNGWDAGESYTVNESRCEITNYIGVGAYNRIVVEDVRGDTNRGDSGHVAIRNFLVSGATTNYPTVIIKNSSYVQLQEIILRSSPFTPGWAAVVENVDTLDLRGISSSASEHGAFYFKNVGTVIDLGGIVAYGVGSDSADAAVTFIDCGRVDGVGVYVDTTGAGNCVDFIGQQIVKAQRLNLNNCAGDAVHVGRGSLFVRNGYTDSGVFLGSGNGGYGVSLSPFSNFVFRTGTNVTGTSGDITLDNGATSLVWGTEFASDGDVVVNSSDFCRAVRKD